MESSVDPVDAFAETPETLPELLKDGATVGIEAVFPALFASALQERHARQGASSAIEASERTIEEHRRVKTTSIQRRSVT